MIILVVKMMKKSDKEDKPTDDKPKAQSNGYVGDKDKTLEQGNPNDSEEYNRDLELDDEAFDKKNKKDANPTPPPPYNNWKLFCFDSSYEHS